VLVVACHLFLQKTRIGKAIRAMGTNAIPWLIADLRLNEPKWKRVLKNWMLKQSLFKMKYRTPDARSSQATWAFEALGSMGRVRKMMSLALVVVRLPLVKLLPATLLWATALPSLTEELAAPAISYTTSTAFPTPPEVLNVTVTLVTAAAFAA